MKNKTSLEELMDFMGQRQYFIGNDLFDKYHELLKKENEKKLTLYGVVSSFLKKEAINRNTPVDELYLRLDTDTEEIDLHYDEDNEGHLRYMDSYK